MRALPLVLCLVLIPACSDQGPGDGPLKSEIERRLEHWRDVRPASYTYVVERLCFCGVEARGPVRVVVAGEAVQARTYVEDGRVVPGDLATLFPSVDGLFETLLDAVARGAHEVRVEWDEATGVPKDIWIDYDEGIADEEVGFRVVTLPE